MSGYKARSYEQRPNDEGSIYNQAWRLEQAEKEGFDAFCQGKPKQNPYSLTGSVGSYYAWENGWNSAEASPHLREQRQGNQAQLTLF